MAALGLNSGPQTAAIRLQVSDGINSGETTVDLQIANAAPTFDVGVDVAVPPEASGTSRRSIEFADVGLADDHLDRHRLR